MDGAHPIRACKATFIDMYSPNSEKKITSENDSESQWNFNEMHPGRANYGRLMKGL